MYKLSAECVALKDYLKAEAARNAEQEKSINLLKLDLADCKFNASKKSKALEKPEREVNQLRSELQQLEHCNHYLAAECRRKGTVIESQMNSLKNESQKRRLRIVFSRLKIKI